MKKLTSANIGDAIAKAKEKAKGKEGAAGRSTKKKVKRLQRTKRKMAVEAKRTAPKAEAKA
ncbi:MAG: hypothetical protein HZA03_06155 [Nitrospinae bacterium]|nr:hypothetical protein [Nitrospinota bacterium]